MGSVQLSLDITVRDLQQVDLDQLDWSGGPAHMAALSRILERSWDGEVEFLVAELPTGQLVAHGGVDFEHTAHVGWVWTLATHPVWQGLGVGGGMIAELEVRIRDRGLRVAELSVELDNPRAAALYRRLGYRRVGTVVETWPLDSGDIYHADCDLMRHVLA